MPAAALEIIDDQVLPLPRLSGSWTLARWPLPIADIDAQLRALSARFCCGAPGGGAGRPGWMFRQSTGKRSCESMVDGDSKHLPAAAMRKQKHEGCKYGRLPKSRQEFWAAKIAWNRQRDRENLRSLEDGGWRVLVVWQCELKNVELLLRTRLYEFIESE